MRYVRPSFYDSFSCIGGACHHNCCIGWEIDVDDETADLYASIGGEFGNELSEKITSEGGRHFRLQPDGRCPFLNEHNLCRIILTLGEDALGAVREVGKKQDWDFAVRRLFDSFCIHRTASGLWKKRTKRLRKRTNGQSVWPKSVKKCYWNSRLKTSRFRNVS